MARLYAASKRLMVWMLIASLTIPFVVGGGSRVKAEAAGGNVIVNSGFESVTNDKPDSWVHSAGVWGTEFGLSNTEKHTGNYSVFIDHSTSEGFPFWAPAARVALDETKEYEFSVWLKVEDSNMSGNPMLNLDFYGTEINPVTNDTWISATNKKLDKSEMTGDWQKLTYRFQPLAGAKEANVYLMVAGGTGRVYFDDVEFGLVAADPEPGAGDYKIWTATNTMNLTRKAKPLDAASVTLDMAGREYQSGQVLVTAQDGKADITNATVTDLTYGTSVIPASQIQILVQQYVQVTQTSNAAHGPGAYPDALIPLDAYMNKHGKITVNPSDNQALWFTVWTEPETPAGVYQGTIALAVNGEVNNVPIQVRVRSFSLPEENHARTAFNITGGDMLLAGHPGIADKSPEYWELMRNYYHFMLDYHVTPSDLPIPANSYSQYILDAEPYIRDPRVSAYNLPYTIGDFENGKAAALVNGLKQKGLLDKAYYYLGGEIDEPTPSMFPKVVQRSQQIAAIDPDLRHVVTTGLHAELKNDVNTFTPLFSEFLSQTYIDEAKRLQAEGGQMWWYGCVTPKYPYPTYHIDDDLISARLVSWMQRSYGIEGNLYWSVNVYKKFTGTQYVARDIWNDPLAYPGANGDGYLLYPGTKYGINGPIATLRLQTIRDGNQDFEYLWLLEQRIKEAAQLLGVDVKPEQIMQPYYDRLFTNVKTFTKDVGELQAVRSEVADLIEQLERDPKALILVNDHPALSSKKEIVVYAAKGTEVAVDGDVATAEPIANNTNADLYKKTVTVAPGMNQVTIRLRQAGQELTAVKYIYVKPREIEPIIKKIIINNFADAQSLTGVTADYQVQLEGPVTDHATGEGKALKATVPVLTGEAYPGVHFPVRPEIRNIAEYESVELDVFNDSTQTMHLSIKFFDSHGKASDHRLGTLVPGANHLSFPLVQVFNLDRENLSSILFWTFSSTTPVPLYFSDLHFLAVDEEAMKGMELPYSPIVPAIDGALSDPVWQLDRKLFHKTGTTNNTASYDLRYNKEYLFIAVDVADSQVINSQAANPWDDDSVEIFVSGSGNKGDYDDQTVHYVFRYNDSTVHAYGAWNKQTEDILHQSLRTADGYAMEIAIPWHTIGIQSEEGNVIGLTIHVNDKGSNDASAATQGKLSLTADAANDAVSSLHWADKVLTKSAMTFALEKISDQALVIDGKLDESAWKPKHNIGQRTFGFMNDAHNAASLGLRWSPTYLYAAFDVKDSNVHAPQTKPVGEETSVELFVDGNFTRGIRDSSAHQYTIRFDDDSVYYNGSAGGPTDGIVHQSVKTADGYQIEMAIPWETIGVTAEKGKWIGITSHVNFVQDSGGAVFGLTENGTADVTTTADYLPFQLIENNDPVDPGTPGNPDNGSGSGIVWPSVPVENSGVLTVLPGDISSAQSIELKPEQTEVALPLATLRKIKDSQANLLLVKGETQLTLTKEWAEALLKGQQADNAELQIQINKLDEGTGKQWAELAAKTQYADIFLNGAAWELHVWWISSGEKQAIDQLPAPWILSLPHGQQALDGVYRLQEGGQVAYAGGKPVADRLEAALKQTGVYAVLSYNKKFDDVAAAHWGTKAIQKLAARQVVNGTSQSAFTPERQVTRAEFTALIVRALGLVEKEATDNITFPDVKSTDWFASAVAAAAKAGLIQGNASGSFSPGEMMSREQMAVLLVRAYAWKNGENAALAERPSRYADEGQISSWAKASVQAADGLELMKGRSANSFAPKGVVSRAESAQAIYNLMKVLRLIS